MITPEGDYLSNLQAPDLRPYFKHLHWRVMPHSMGHLVASDWADKADDDPVFGLYKKCGLWTRDEAAILYHCAGSVVAGDWLDIGSHTSWTSAHILATAAERIEMVDPLYRLLDDGGQANEVYWRSWENLAECGFIPHWRRSYLATEYNEKWPTFKTLWMWRTSLEYFKKMKAEKRFVGINIDGDHEPGKPLEDAQNAYKHLADTGVIVFHDGLGRPVREAVTWLMDQGFKARCYWTPHLVFVCWRGDVTPPEHEPDKRIDWRPHVAEMAKDFDFGRLD